MLETRSATNFTDNRHHHRQQKFFGIALLTSLILALFALLAPPSIGDDWTAAAPMQTTGHPTFLSPHAKPIVLHNGYVYATNTPADTVDVIDAATNDLITRIHVGIDPVGTAVRPDGTELWIANHISDSVSVIDIDPASPTYHQVVATVQDIDPATKATRFDEPVGVAFADNNKAYVSLSALDQIAIIDVATRAVTGHLDITAQDPRAMTVRDGKLYVVPFESNNQTQLSGCLIGIGPRCTFSALEHVILSNNVLSLGYDADIVKQPSIPDRDLFVFDTATDQLLETVDTIGTLLYGLTVDSNGNVFVAQTDARNDANGKAGTADHTLLELGNRAFLNQITAIACGNGSCSEPLRVDLEPLPPSNPTPELALATPYGIQVSDDDATLVVTAASSNKLFTIDAATGAVIGRAEVDSVPRGIALESDENGAASRAWVLNVVENSVSLVDLSVPSDPTVLETITLDDPTDPELKLGRELFNSAFASSTGTFSCESCHPDGHTDQLLWVLDTPACDIEGCTQIPPRSTMPLRGLRDTEPYHWDGIPSDPHGLINTANVFTFVEPNCDETVPGDCIRVLVDGSLGSTMCDQTDCPTNDEGKPGLLTGAERDALGQFLLSIPYPPAQERAYTNELSPEAVAGFNEFHLENDCGQCHRMPFWNSTNTPLSGMDAPTWRGAYDRWLILPQGRLNLIDVMDLFTGGSTSANGFDEREIWEIAGATDGMWQMVLEGSTGFSGSFARQLTLNEATAGATTSAEILDALEQSASEGGILLQGHGIVLRQNLMNSIKLNFVDGSYEARLADGDDSNVVVLSRAQLLQLAEAGEMVVTLTGRVGANVDHANPQPALWTRGPIHRQHLLSPPTFPVLETNEPINIKGRHITADAAVIIDGRRVQGTVSCAAGALPNCVDEAIVIELAELPADDGIHLLQIQNRDGLFSNDFIFFTGDVTLPTQPAQSGQPESIHIDDSLIEQVLKTLGVE